MRKIRKHNENPWCHKAFFAHTQGSVYEYFMVVNLLTTIKSTDYQAAIVLFRTTLNFAKHNLCTSASGLYVNDDEGRIRKWKVLRNFSRQW